MGLPVEINPLFVSSTAGYTVGRSLRFRSSASAYLNRTNVASPTNANKWTMSWWMKRGNSGSSYVFSATNSSNDDAYMQFNSDKFTLGSYQGAGTDYGITTSAVFRDYSAWYHIVCVYDSSNATSADRAIIYINGVRQTVTNQSNGMFPLNYTGNKFNLGSQGVRCALRGVFNDNQFDGYLAEVNFIDGQALTPSSFGAYDTNGVWQPIKYTGTYGTNGFYLPFSNTTSTTTLVQDSSGNGNNWTPNNISLTAGTTYDSMIDSPTVSASSSNYAVLNPLTIRGATGTLTNGNLSAAASSSSSPADTSMYATLALPSNGLIYLEALYTVTAGLGNDTRIGVSTVGDTGSYVQAGSTTGYWSYDYKNGTANAQGSNTSYTAASTGQTVMFAIDIANGKIWAGANGTWYNSGNPASGTGAVVTSVSTSAIYLQTTLNGWVNRCSLDFNFGQRPFSYTPPTGYSALNTYNLPTPTIKNGASYMAATTYTGNGTSQTINNGTNTTIGTSFQPDFIWIKDRSTASAHALTNSVVGTTKYLESNTTGAEATDTTSVTAINSNGFSLGAGTATYYTNRNGDSFVGWQWKGGGTGVTNTSGSITSTVSANTTAGFSIVTYTGNGTSPATVGHGLGVAPDWLIFKNRDTAQNWESYHSVLGATKYIEGLNTTAAAATSTIWNNTSPTSSVFTINGTDVNTNGRKYVVYCWTAIKGYSAFGSYTGNGSSDGPFVYTGFRPRWVMIKRTDSTQNWPIIDTSRDTYNVANKRLFANLSDAEDTGIPNFVDVLSNGFKCRDSNISYNASGGTYIYAAFAENPFNYSRAR